jgi:hypothetical protein
MACCGKERQQLYGKALIHRDIERRGDALSHREPKRYSYTYFQYLGRTGLTVVGPVSGNRYRFNGHGAIVAVDPRDRLSLSTVPNLRQVRNP